MQFPKCKSNLPSVSYLAEKFPVSKKELEDCIKDLEEKRKSQKKSPVENLHEKIGKSVLT